MKKLLGIVFGMSLLITAMFGGAAPAAHATNDPIYNQWRSYFCGDTTLWLANGIYHGTTGDDTSFVYPAGGGKGACYFGLEGNDAATGNNGMNGFLGGPGNDIVNLGDSNNSSGPGDEADGNDGNDAIYGQNGDDYLYGGDGDDYVEGDANDDTIFGGEVCDENNWWLWIWDTDHAPSASPDQICGYGDGADTLLGGNGDDWIWESNSDVQGDGVVDTVNGGGGYDHCTVETIDIVVNCDVITYIP